MGTSDLMHLADLLLLSGQGNFSSVGMRFHSFGEFATRYRLQEFDCAHCLTDALGLIDERKSELAIPSYFIIVTCFNLDHAHTILSVTIKNKM